MKVDIVGGSLSGLSAAAALKQQNKSLKVIVHEKHHRIGYNHDGRRCGEAHSIESPWSQWKPEPQSIFTEITDGELFIGEKKYISHTEPGTGYILNRQEFICQLGRTAEKLGAIIQTDDKIKSVADLNGDYIIDASGCPSVIKRELNLNRGFQGMTYQQTLEHSNRYKPSTIQIIFSELDGYFWIFPRNPKTQEINLGVGLFGRKKINLKQHLEAFKKEQDITGTVNYTTGGLIPGGLQRPLQHKNILFVGDAGVGTFPINGQGNYRALISGQTAGTCIAQGYPHRYTKLIYRDFMKWDVIGKLFMSWTGITQHIGKKALFLTARFAYRSLTTLH